MSTNAIVPIPQHQGKVTLDFSKAQPLDMSTYQPIDFSKYATPPLPAGYTLDNAPPSQSLSIVSSEPISKPQGETERFARSFNKGITGAEDPSQLWENLKGEASDIAQHGASADPTPILKSIHQGMQNVWNRATQEFKAGNLTSAQGMLNYLNSAVHAVESGVPVVGPMLSDADKQLAQGNMAGAAGTTAAAAAPFVAGEMAGPEAGTVTNPAAVPKPASGVLPAIGKVARTASDIVNPDYTGLISPRAAHAQRALGRLADAIDARRAAAAPVPEPPASMQPGSWSGPVKTASPSSATPTDVTQAGGAYAPAESAPTMASQDDIAQGLGYKDSKQAQSHLGPDVWNKTYNKLAQDDLAARQAGAGTSAGSVPESPTPPDVNTVIDQAIPPAGSTKGLNMKTKAEVDFYVQKGNVDAAKSAIQRAANTVSPASSDDAAFQEMGREDLDRSGRTAWQEKNAMRLAAESPAVGKTEMSARQKASAAAQAAYEATMQQEMPAFSRQGQPQSLAVELPADEDLTSLLQRSVDQAKKGKKTASPAEMSPWGGRFAKAGQ